MAAPRFAVAALLLLHAQPALAVRQQLMEATVEADQTGCPGVLKANICKQDSKMFLENIMGLNPTDLACLKQWCPDPSADADSQCCQTVLTLIANLKGQNAASLKMPSHKFNALAEASGISAEDLAAEEPVKKEIDMLAGKDEETATTPASDAAAGDGDVDSDQCWCDVPDRSKPGRFSLGKFPKNNWKMSSRDGGNGGKCTKDTPCDKCARKEMGDLLRCCQMGADGSVGQCGEQVKAAKFNGESCHCSGVSVSKERLRKETNNDECFADTECETCCKNYHRPY